MDNVWQPLTFLSKKLFSAETRYSTFDRELLAVYATIRHFGHNLEGRNYFVNTDHKPLTYVMSSAIGRPSLRQTRHLAYITELTTDIRYVQGETIFVADALSRPSVSAIGSASVFTWLRNSTSCTLDFQLLISFDNNLIWCNLLTGQARLYITAKFQRKAFTNLHGLGHLSHRATKPLIYTRFVWHGMNILEHFGKGCQTAQISRHNKLPFGKLTEPKERFDHVHVDIVSLLSYSAGFKYLFTCVDRFMRWLRAIPLVDIKAETVADASFSGWIARFGMPATITTDRGAQFKCKLWDNLCN